MELLGGWRGEAVRIVGAGAIGCALAESLAAPGRRIALYTRHAGAVRGWPAGVEVRPLAELAPESTPIILCLSAPERELVAAEIARGAAEVPRAVVARASVVALDQDLPWAALAGAPVLVVTNPVELVCELVARRAPEARVLGFGMRTDRARIGEALARGFGVADPGAALAVTGRHGGRAIPVLSEHPAIMERLAPVSAPEVRARLETTRGTYETAPGRAAALFARMAPEGRHDPQALVYATLRAITAAEFDGPRPPIARPVEQLAAQVSAWLAGRPEEAPEVSGAVVLSRAAGRAGTRAFLGGRLGPRGFAIPTMGAAERAILTAELAEHDAQVAALLEARA